MAIPGKLLALVRVKLMFWFINRGSLHAPLVILPPISYKMRFCVERQVSKYGIIAINFNAVIILIYLKVKMKYYDEVKRLYWRRLTSYRICGIGWNENCQKNIFLITR